MKVAPVLRNTNCYEAAWELFFDHMDETYNHDALLVHGQPIYRGTDTPDLPDGRYHHAWVEWRGLVFDFSHGNQFVVRLSDYYRIGQMTDDNITRYTRADALHAAIDYGHWGPWA